MSDLDPSKVLEPLILKRERPSK